MTKKFTAEDGLVAAEVGQWASEKHKYLKSYLDISSGVRKKFLTGRAKSATYIDLFCGPGRAKVKETDDWIDGSAIAAWRISRKSNTPFSAIYVADTESEYRNATAERLKKLDAPVVELEGDAITAAKKVKDMVNPHGFNFAFLDPFSLGTLDFEIIKSLAKLKRMDMLIHISAMDHQRNLNENISAEDSALDNFAPGWDEHVDLNAGQQNIRQQIIKYWIDLVGTTGKTATETEDWELIRGNRNQRLYWLLLVADHKLANDFWKKISPNEQGKLL